MAKKHASLANLALKDRIDEVYRIVPSGYTLHLVTSGSGISREAEVKLQNFIETLKAPTTDFFLYEVEDLKTLQDRFYTRNLPTVDKSIPFELQRQSPYMVRADNHDSYTFMCQAMTLQSFMISLANNFFNKTYEDLKETIAQTVQSSFLVRQIKQQIFITITMVLHFYAKKPGGIILRLS